MTGLDPLAGTHEIATPDDMEALGERIGGMLRPGDLVVLTGPLGAGKTTLTRGIAEGLGVRGPVQSPTFVLARTHPSLVGGAPLVHVDAYRLGSAMELDDLDIDVEGSVVVVEWGRGMVDGLRDGWWEIELERQLGGHGADTMRRDLAHASDGLDTDGLDTDGLGADGLDTDGLDADGLDADGLGADGLGADELDADALDADEPRVVTIRRRP